MNYNKFYHSERAGLVLRVKFEYRRYMGKVLCKHKKILKEDKCKECKFEKKIMDYRNKLWEIKE